MFRFILITLNLAFLTLGFACVPYTEGASPSTPLQGQAAYFEGSLSNMEGISDFASRIEEHGNGNVGVGYTLKAYGPVNENGERALAIMHVESSDFNHEALSPGASLVFNEIPRSDYDPRTDLHITVTGCLFDEDSMTYDDVADEVTVWVTALPNEDFKRVSYMATWTSSSDRLVGYFDVPVR